MVKFFKPKPKVINKKHQEIKITKIDYQGVGIGYIGKITTFVSGLLPGEKALVQITQQKKNYAKAKLIKRLSDSDMRQPSFCAQYGHCGGCSLQHLSVDDQLELKEDGLLQLLQRAIPQLDSEILKTDTLQQRITSESTHYRRSARFSIHKGKIGFREAASKNIIDIQSCPILGAHLHELLPDLRELLFSMKTPLGHLELIQADNTPVLFLRATKALSDQDNKALVEWCSAKRVSCYLAHTSDDMIHLCGEEPYYRIDKIKLYFMPRDFIQVNTSVNNRMVAQAIDWLDITAEDRVLDLFCGLGNFSLPLAKYADEVIGVEGVDAMVERAKSNARKNGLRNVNFYQANLQDDISDKPWAQQGFNKVLLDPARAGAFEVMSHIVNIDAEKILYVSCNPTTLATDAKILVENGYQVHKIGVLNMFPHTGHIESMILFVK